MLPDEPGKQELLQGELIALPPAKRSHNAVTQTLFELLRTVLDSTRVHMEAGYQMSHDTWLQPDVSVEWPDQRIENDYLQGSPMLAIEVVSPGNSAEEIDRKISAYLNHGAAEVWVIYPRTRCMMVHRSAGAERVTDSYTSGLIPVTVPVSEILSGE